MRAELEALLSGSLRLNLKSSQGVSLRFHGIMPFQHHLPLHNNQGVATMDGHDSP